MEPVKPVGLDDFVHTVTELCLRSQFYDPEAMPVLAMPLPSGCGQSTALRYLSRQLSRSMEPGDDWTRLREYRLSGSPEQMVHCFLDMHSSSATSNFFRGCVGWDLSAMTGSLACSQAARDFPMELEKLSRHACNLLFLPKGDTPLSRHLKQTIPELQVIPVEPYTPRQLAQIALIQLQNTGIQLEQYDVLEELVLQQVRSAAAATPRDLRRLTCRLRFAAQRSGHSYILTPDSLSGHLEQDVHRGG